MANIYSDDAVLERYHIYMTHKIMRMSEADVLSKLSPSERVEFRATITAGVMATDMAKHFLLTEKLVQSSKTIPPFVVTDPASRYAVYSKCLPCIFLGKCFRFRQALVGFVIHCADIGAQTQKKELALKWGQRVLEEFQHQAALEEKLNIPTAPFMQGLDSELARMKLQQGFVAGIVIPLWSALADCLPRLHPCVERAEIMKDFYEEQVQILSVGVLASPRRSGTDVLLASSSSKSLR